MEDEFEYRGYQWSSQGFWFPLGEGWWELHHVKGYLNIRRETAEKYQTGDKFKIMRRRKAGQPIDFKEEEE